MHQIVQTLDKVGGRTRTGEEATRHQQCSASGQGGRLGPQLWPWGRDPDEATLHQVRHEGKQVTVGTILTGHKTIQVYNM